MKPHVLPIGSRMRERRRELGLTLSDVARLAGISLSYLSLIEHNKRVIAGARLRRLAEALQLRLDALTDISDARVAQDLTGVFSDGIFDRLELREGAAQRLVGFDGDLGRAFLTLYRAYAQGRDQVEALANRLNQDPVLLELSHQILNRIAAVRSISELLRDVAEIPEARRRSFHRSLVDESGTLGTMVGTLLEVVSRGNVNERGAGAVEEVDDFIVDHGNHFSPLEDEARRLRARLEGTGRTLDQALGEALARDHGIDVRLDSTLPAERAGFDHDPERRLLILPRGAPAASVRFRMMRLLARLTSADAIVPLTDDHRLTSDASRQRARDVLERYLAAALLFPYEEFLAAATTLRYDVERLGQQFGGSFEQVCHRLTTLKRAGAAGIPFGFLRVDPAGNISKRLGLPGLRLPRYRESCARWAVFQAFSMPDRVVAQRAVLPTGAEFLMIARMVARPVAGYGAPHTRFGVMIACDAAYRDQLVYGDGDGPRAPAVPIGITCRLCLREDCGQRAHPQIVAGRPRPART